MTPANHCMISTDLRVANINGLHMAMTNATLTTGGRSPFNGPMTANGSFSQVLEDTKTA